MYMAKSLPASFPGRRYKGKRVHEVGGWGEKGKRGWNSSFPCNLW
jgi:hypothetical protein